MNKPIIALSGVIGGTAYFFIGKIGLAVSIRIPPPEWLHAKMEPFSWAVNVWRIVEWSPFVVAALIIGWGLLLIAKEDANWAALVSAMVVFLILGNQLTSFGSLMSQFAVFVICLLPVTVFFMRAYNKSLNTDASKAGAG